MQSSHLQVPQQIHIDSDSDDELYKVSSNQNQPSQFNSKNVSCTNKNKTNSSLVNEITSINNESVDNNLAQYKSNQIDRINNLNYTNPSIYEFESQPIGNEKVLAQTDQSLAEISRPIEEESSVNQLEMSKQTNQINSNYLGELNSKKLVIALENDDECTNQEVNCSMSILKNPNLSTDSYHQPQSPLNVEYPVLYPKPNIELIKKSSKSIIIKFKINIMICFKN